MVWEESSVISVMLLDGRMSELPETVTVVMVEKSVVRGGGSVITNRELEVIVTLGE